MLGARAIFPQPEPALCVTFFTCIGTNVEGTSDLQHTYAHAVTYLEAQRSGTDGNDTGRLPYELVWVDNGGDARAHTEFIARGAQFEVVRRNPSNEGLFRAVNDVWFRGHGCRAPYVLSLEDDRVPRPDLGMSRVPHLALSIELLRRETSLSGVRLKDEWSDDIISRAQEDEGAAAEPQMQSTTPMTTPPSSAAAEARHVPPLRKSSGLRLAYARHCLALGSGFVWGAFSMAAVVYDREVRRRSSPSAQQPTAARRPALCSALPCHFGPTF